MRRLAATLLLLTGAAALADEVHDPMRPADAVVPRAAARVPAPAQLSGVIIAPERRAAIIDGHVVSVGERAGLCLVLEVLDDSVRCRFPNGVRLLSLPGRAADVKTHTATALAATGVPKP